MTKNLSTFFTLLMLMACASSHVARTQGPLNFDSVKNIVSDSPSQKEIIEKFGEPTERIRDGSYERWRYTDVATNFNRVDMVFSESKKIEQLFWFPLPEEADSRIKTIFARYPKGHFKPVSVRNLAPDDLDTETTYANDIIDVYSS